MNEFTILIADDHPMFLQGITDALHKCALPLYIDSVKSYIELFELLDKSDSEVDLILLDLEMPGSTSDAGIYYVRRIYPEIPIVVLSAHDTIDVKIKCLSLGASEFLSKSMDVEKLVQCIVDIMHGEYQFPATPSRSANSDSVNKVASLTPSQFKVLHLIACGHSNKKIADLLQISEKTVKNHISMIFGKLDVTNRTQAGNLFNAVSNSNPKL
ncbi:response regulator transcription factor [Pseudoalteromonas prydzensis]|uniref:response regulator transcription factor n=1 Tax=Pseudoalteromonas prydzensis TaxID=182141 RepID=UPI0007E4F944|nr:response regulator transcription factor [Pseudoalteromonas prydzensis]MBE0380258.1 hypothetical protein [Pseudoalteromonas prydzensis ACAM 620]